MRALAALLLLVPLAPVAAAAEYPCEVAVCVVGDDVMSCAAVLTVACVMDVDRGAACDGGDGGAATAAMVAFVGAVGGRSCWGENRTDFLGASAYFVAGFAAVQWRTEENATSAHDSMYVVVAASQGPVGVWTDLTWQDTSGTRTPCTMDSRTSVWSPVRSGTWTRNDACPAPPPGVPQNPLWGELLP